jgi:hypothetical protein
VGGKALVIQTFPKFPILNLRHDEAALYRVKRGHQLLTWWTFSGESLETKNLSIVEGDIFSGEEKLHASTERTEISVVDQNLVSMFHLWQQFCSTTAHLLPRSAAAALLRPSCVLLSVLRSADSEPNLQRICLLQCLSHDSEFLKTEAVNMFASCTISSHDLHRSSSNRALTINTDV